MIAHNDIPLLERELMAYALYRGVTNPHVFQLPDRVTFRHEPIPHDIPGAQEAITWTRARISPENKCDECGESITAGYPALEAFYYQGFALTAEGFVSFFLCDSCGEHYLCSDGELTPKVTGELKRLGLESADELREALLKN